MMKLRMPCRYGVPLFRLRALFETKLASSTIARMTDIDQE
jgi:hypothetical protein